MQDEMVERLTDYAKSILDTTNYLNDTLIHGRCKWSIATKNGAVVLSSTDQVEKLNDKDAQIMF